MCIDICPVGALTSGTYRYQTRPWEMTYVGRALRALLERLQDHAERPQQRNSARAIIAIIPASTANSSAPRAASDSISRSNPERIRQPLVRRNGKLEPASWEDALEEVARRLKQVHATHGGSAIGVIGSNHTTNEENYLLNRFARVTLGTNNLDHHRTADYAGLAAALGPNAKNSLATMADVYNASAILLIGNDVTQPESAGGLADSHRRAPSQRRSST